MTLKTTKPIFIDHYKNLGIGFTASRDEVKKAFRRLAKTMHPDTPTGDKLSFTNLYYSYETLASDLHREIYDQNYKKFYAKQEENYCQTFLSYKRIPSSRLHYPINISTLAQYGLFKKKIRGRHIKFFLNLNYDMELFLREDEFKQSISILVPIIARSYCPECFGSNTYCFSCRGVGSYKKTSQVEVRLIGGISPDFIFTVGLRNRKAGNMSHFKKDKLLIKTVLKNDI